MPDTVSFLDTTFKDLRCQNPVCQAQATHEKRITLKNLLFTGWECHYCKLVHEGAFPDYASVPELLDPEDESVPKAPAKKKTAKKTAAKKENPDA